VYDDRNLQTSSRGDAAEACMTPDALSSLLRASQTDATEPGPACPDEHSVAAYVDGTLTDDDRDSFELHLADCSHCLALVGLLSREYTVAATDPVPELAIARARTLAQPAARRGRSFAPQWASAAVVVLAAAALVRFAVLPQSADTEWRPDAPTTRTTKSAGLSLLSPAPGSTVGRNQLAVRWTPVPGAHYYEVRVVTDAGDVVTDEQVTGTEWRPGNQAALQPGPEYFVHVDAYVSEGKSIGSEHVSFHVSE
jgi:hypothetical protein